jgi:hypothetical protein
MEIAKDRQQGRDPCVGSRFVLGRFMPDEKLTPATRNDVEICLALALTSGGALARSQAAETMSKIVAERLAAELEASGFVTPHDKWAQTLS